MITTRIYQKVCDSCKGAGVIPEPLPTSTSITRMCPACNEGVVLVTETIETKDSKITDEMIKNYFKNCKSAIGQRAYPINALIAGAKAMRDNKIK